MEAAKLILACVLNMVAGGDPIAGCNTEFNRDVASAITESSQEFGVPAEVIAAVIYHESRFKKNAKGKYGEAGLMQIKRHGAVEGANLRFSFKQLCDVHRNIRIGTAYLAKMQVMCSTRSRWLTRYNHGGSGGCTVSRYSSGVLADLKSGYRAISTLVLTAYYQRLVDFYAATS